MNYATPQDLIDRFGERELVQLTDPDLLAVQTEAVERAIADAQALADGALGCVYRLPLPGCLKPEPTELDPLAQVLVPPPQLTRIVCDVARYYLYKDLAPEHEVALRYKAAAKELADIAQGKAVLACPWGGVPGVLVAGAEPGTNEVSYGFGAQQITDASLRGFA